jgi:hypothetical protein
LVVVVVVVDLVVSSSSVVGDLGVVVVVVGIVGLLLAVKSLINHQSPDWLPATAVSVDGSGLALARPDWPGANLTPGQGQLGVARP